MNKKEFSSIIIVVLALIIIAGGAGYFIFVKKLQPATQQQTDTTAPTDTNQALKSPTPTDNQKSSQLLAPAVNRYTLTFDTNSVCDIGLDKGQCIVLLSSFTGGENVTIDGLQGLLRKETDGSWFLVSATKIVGSGLVVKGLILNDNLATNGHLVQSLSGSGQKTWNLVYQPLIDDSAVQDPNRPTSTIPLKFDEKSMCGDTGQKKCSIYELHQNDWVFTRGIKYGGVFLVRLLTIPATAPSTLPR